MTAFFIRLVGASDKAKALKDAVATSATPARFEVDPSSFARVPGSPFAYWASSSLLAMYGKHERLASKGKSAFLGASSKNDPRFLRLWWEVPHKDLGAKWISFAKGGAASPYYGDVYLVINWDSDARELEAELLHKYPYLNGSAEFVLHRSNPYMRPGITWTRRTTSQFGPRALPSGCVFSDKGPAAFVEDDDEEELLSLLATMNSAPFRALVGLQLAAADLAARSYEVGIIQKTPVPNFSNSQRSRLVALASEAVEACRRDDAHSEITHAFVGPASIFGNHAEARHLNEIQSEIDDIVCEAYGISASELEVTTDLLAASDDDDEFGGQTTRDQHDDLLSWAVGVVFGRFRLPEDAVGSRLKFASAFDRIARLPPAMLGHIEDPSLVSRQAAVDDPGHPDDLARLVASVLESHGCTVDTSEIRGRLRYDFFNEHIGRYSMSRRRAPVYWQLATPTSSYSTWIYIHSFDSDTLFRVRNDLIHPKLVHERRQLADLRARLTEQASSAERSDVEANEVFVQELQTLYDEVGRVAPLWNPNLHDGVILNFAPLWRVVPQNKAWQRELKATWDALCAGKFDWSHLAMHLWPERVIPKCATDRSLAIAHGLEDVFWVEADFGKWKRRATPARPEKDLVRERTSDAVKAALKDLLEAPEPAAAVRRARRKA